MHGICMYTQPNGDIKILEYINNAQDPHGKMTFISKMSGTIFNVTYNGDLEKSVSSKQVKQHEAFF